ncbi:hypothetical protein Ciccas_014291 [Cichlidogyrus casuarinus]|uniref:Uncharacterized protein n=1 Tax=Cichlidogyrus casuarinus TaxID=1844966 RepID=A0ABD2PII6_9PLAT
MLDIGKIVQCNWDEPEDLKDNFNHYLVNVSGTYRTQARGNVITLKDLNGTQFNQGAKYHLNVYVVDNNNKLEPILENHAFGIETGVYDQETMDNLAEAIAKKLKGSKKSQKRDLAEELAEISQPWSYDMKKLMLVISNDETSFAGEEGFKGSDIRSEEPCLATANFLVKCDRLFLKEGTRKNYIFTWPDTDEYGPGMMVQLRFFYEDHVWYATKIYSLDDTDNESSQSTNSESKTLMNIPSMMCERH